jgi:hypothetical protein
MRFVQAAAMLLGAAAYFVLFYFYWEESNTDLLWPAVIGWNALSLVVTVLVIIDSVRKIRAGKTGHLARGVFVVKLAAIPFFVINFAILSLVGLFGLAFTWRGIGIAFVAAAAIGAVLTFLAMLSTSVYGWATIIQLRREGRIDKKRVVIYTILLFVFVADIVAGILLFATYRRGAKSVAAAQAVSVES